MEAAISRSSDRGFQARLPSFMDALRRGAAINRKWSSPTYKTVALFGFIRRGFGLFPEVVGLFLQVVWSFERFLDSS